jgi:Ran-interacting Mog1 protein
MPPTDQSRGSRDLFGGAIRAVVPSEFTDVSILRQIPDNQEVFAHADTDRSLLFELLQSEKDVSATGAAPARFHWDILVRDSSAQNVEIILEEEIPLSRLSQSLARAEPNIHASVVYGTHQVAKFRDSDEHANVVNVSLTCMRLPRAATDVLIVFNDPISIHHESSSAREGATVDRPELHDVAQRAAILQSAVLSFDVVNWSLFG